MCGSDVARLNRQIRAATAEQAQLDAVLRKPENAEVLERSVFLNTLLLPQGDQLDADFRRPGEDRSVQREGAGHPALGGLRRTR